MKAVDHIANNLTSPSRQRLHTNGILAGGCENRKVALSREQRNVRLSMWCCETGTGILNPLHEVAAVVKACGRRLMVDAMSTFGAIPVDQQALPIDALIAASEKYLEGVPGMGFILADRKALDASMGRSHSLAMDLHYQWGYVQDRAVAVHAAHPCRRGAPRGDRPVPR